MTIVEPQAHVEAAAEPDTAVESGAAVETDTAAEAEPQVDAGAVPRPAPELDFFGEYQGSGYAEPRYLVRRSDGQVIQLTLLLDLVLRQIDGTRDLAAIASAVTASFGRPVRADDVAYLIEHKLQPVGLVAAEDDAERVLPRTDLLLAMRGHRTLIGQRQVLFLARALAWLHRPPVVALVLAAALAFDGWLFGRHGAVGPLVSVVNQPLMILAVLGLGLASMVFHEFGHASACHYSGARPGRIGCGIFLIWPSLYTDVTDVYRVGRRGRLRTDLGGVYFNTVFFLGLAGVYAWTQHPVFLAAVLFVHFEILDQLLPVVRLDGYFILADLAGVPDLFGRIRPILISLLPRNRAQGRPGDLRRGARIAVTTWVLVTVPLLLAELVWLVWNLPRLTRTSVDSVTAYLRAIHAEAGGHQWAQLTLDSVAVILLVIPAIGLTWLLLRVAGRLGRAGLRRAAKARPTRAPRGRHRR
jgi:putative peptide zinc metalloprotease protein